MTELENDLMSDVYRHIVPLSDSSWSYLYSFMIFIYTYCVYIYVCFWAILSSCEFSILRSFWGGNVNQQQIEVWVVKMQFLSDLGFLMYLESWKKCDFPEHKQITYTTFSRDRFRSPLPHSLGEKKSWPHEIPNGKRHRLNERFHT